MKYHILLILLISLLAASCARNIPYIKVTAPPSKTTPPPEEGKKAPTDSYVVDGERYYPLPDALGFIETGKASWYGDEFHGRPTSSGEIYDMYKKTAAHKTLPLGTYVRVINLDNNESTIVRINDRGPFIKGRVIDLSYGAAKEIHMALPGLANVKVIALGKEMEGAPSISGRIPVLDIKNFETGEFTVQIGAFKDKKNALNLAERLRASFDYVNIMEYRDEDNQLFFRVHVSKSTSLAMAGEFEKKLEEMGFREAFVLRL
jgi:rare lipoprotein A